MENTSISRKLIAERSGVSKRTVTRVLQNDKLVSESTRKKVLQVVEELGYTRNRLAGNLSRNLNSNFVAVLVPDMANYYYLELFDYLTKYLEDYDYIVSIYKIDENNLFRTFDSVLENRVSVIINFGFYPINEEYLKKLNAANIKIIHPGIGVDPVSLKIDYLRAMDDAFRSLTEHGCKNIYFVCGRKEKFAEDGRVRSYLKLMEKYGFGDGESKVYYGDYPQKNAMETGRIVTEKLLYENNADAIFFLNDMMAFGAIHTIQSSGKTIGKDISMIGFDNTKMSMFCDPPLSTVDSQIETEIQRYIGYILDREVPDEGIVAKFIKRSSSV